MKLSVALAVLVSSVLCAGFDEDPGTVYVYRIGQYNGSFNKLTLFCDGKETARLQNGRYFVMKLQPGTHLLSDKQAQYNIKIKIESGRTYYLQAGILMGVIGGHPRFTLTDPQSGAEDIKKVRLLNKENVRDRRVVVEP
jgi:hypothetical protein